MVRYDCAEPSVLGISDTGPFIVLYFWAETFGFSNSRHITFLSSASYYRTFKVFHCDTEQSTDVARAAESQ
jgi:hypothetical protein